MRSSKRRDPGELVALGALGFAALVLGFVLVRGFTGTNPTTNPPAGPMPTFSAPPPFATPSLATPSSLISQSLTFTSALPKGATYGASYVISASAGGSGNPVVFGSLSAAVCTPGVDTTTFDFVGIGPCTIEASQAGNSRYSAALPRTMSFNVHRASQTIAYTSTPNAATEGGSYTVTASAAGGPVTFSADPSSAACIISPTGLVRFTAAATCVIDANQVGNPDFNPAPEIQQVIDVAPTS